MHLDDRDKLQREEVKPHPTGGPGFAFIHYPRVSKDSRRRDKQDNKYLNILLKYVKDRMEENVSFLNNSIREINNLIEENQD